MTDRDTLLELAAQAEAAKGPSIGLFQAAWFAAHPECPNDWTSPDWILPLRKEWTRFNTLCDREAWLDAAMMLVPEGWRIGRLEEDWRTGRWAGQLCRRATPELVMAFDDGRTVGWDTRDTEREGAATPALALVAAALRAQAAMGEG